MGIAVVLGWSLALLSGLCPRLVEAQESSEEHNGSDASLTDEPSGDGNQTRDGIPSEDAAPSDSPSPRALQAAAEAYDQGTAALLAGDFATAADWYETAHRLVPSAPAMMQAIRASELAGDSLRSATLALELLDQWPEEEEAATVARRVLEAAQGHYVLVTVECDGCELSLGDRALAVRRFFILPDEEHALVALFDTGEQRDAIQGTAGEHLQVSVTRPEPPPTPPEDPADIGPLARGRVDQDASAGGGLPPLVALLGAGATAVALGMTVWSGIDTLAAADQYNDMPTRQGLDDGLGKARRTHVFIGVTAALGAATLGVALLFTDWGEQAEPSPNVQASFGISGEGGTLSVNGRF